MEKYTALKNKYHDQIRKKPNVVGIGVGKRQVNKKITDEKAVVVLDPRNFPGNCSARRS